MLCENCGQRQASVHQTVLMNGQKQESHLCAECAQAKGMDLMGGATFSFPNLSINQLLSSFLGQDSLGGAKTLPQQQAEPRCKGCGMTYSEFVEAGRLGCAQCYDDLGPYLEPLIRRIHGTSQHTGKVPKRTGGIMRKRRDLAQLKEQLSDLILREQYEEAAKLRDRIREMEAEVQAGGEGRVVE